MPKTAAGGTSGGPGFGTVERSLADLLTGCPHHYMQQGPEGMYLTRGRKICITSANDPGASLRGYARKKLALFES